MSFVITTQSKESRKERNSLSGKELIDEFWERLKRQLKTTGKHRKTYH